MAFEGMTAFCAGTNVSKGFLEILAINDVALAAIHSCKTPEELPSILDTHGVWVPASEAANISMLMEQVAFVRRLVDPSEAEGSGKVWMYMELDAVGTRRGPMGEYLRIL